MYKRIISIIITLLMLLVLLSSCAQSEDWKEKGYDLSLPILGEDGWYEVFYDDFSENILNPEIWTTSPHGLRWNTQTGNDLHSNYWCSDTVKVENAKVIISSFETENHVCSEGVCPAKGRFSGGIETRLVITNDSEDSKGQHDELLFGQAYGYFEASVKLPNADGLWGAFWLQSSNQRKIGNEGMDGIEIDIFESSFRRSRKSKMGHALLWDGYGEHSQVADYILYLEEDLYDGFHTYALKWTPEYYVFYINGKPTWATNSGGVSRVEQFIRLTVEIDAGDKWGPHGQRIGDFKYENEPQMIVDYVKVYQNSNYKQFIIDDSQFPGELDYDN